MELALHRSPAHLGASYLPCWAHVCSHHQRGLVMGSGQALEALCSLLYSSCHWASLLWALQDSCSLSLHRLACSPHSCHSMWSRVAQAATISFLRAAAFICTSHIHRVSLVIVSLRRSRGHFRAGDRRTLVVLLHGNGQGISALVLHPHVSYALLVPLLWMKGQTGPCQHLLL